MKPTHALHLAATPLLTCRDRAGATSQCQRPLPAPLLRSSPQKNRGVNPHLLMYVRFGHPMQIQEAAGKAGFHLRTVGRSHNSRRMRTHSFDCLFSSTLPAWPWSHGAPIFFHERAPNATLELATSILDWMTRRWRALLAPRRAAMMMLSTSQYSGPQIYPVWASG